MGRTDGRTDTTSYRNALSHQKRNSNRSLEKTQIIIHLIHFDDFSFFQYFDGAEILSSVVFGQQDSAKGTGSDGFVDVKILQAA